MLLVSSQASLCFRYISILDTSQFSIHELLWALRELIGQNKALKFCKALVNHGKTRITQETRSEIEWALDKIANEEASILRFNDKIIISTARKLGIPVLSFDRQMLAQASKEGVAQINPYL